MKKLGLIILVIGVLMTIFAGFNFMTKEKVIEVGTMNIMADHMHTMAWSPYLGIGIIAIGLVIYLVGARNRRL